MGSIQAQEMAELMDIDSALAWHLRANHYPPVPVSMVEPCKEAIQACVDNDWYREITLPDGVLYKNSNTAPAFQIVEQHHLHAWTELDEEGLED